MPGPGTFKHVAREWLATVPEVKVSAGHAERTRIRLEQDVVPWIGKRPIIEIEAPELPQCLRRVESRGAIQTAHRIKDACGQMFRYGITAGHCMRNPVADLRDALRPVTSSRVVRLAAYHSPERMCTMATNKHIPTAVGDHKGALDKVVDMHAAISISSTSGILRLGCPTSRMRN